MKGTEGEIARPSSRVMAKNKKELKGEIMHIKRKAKKKR